MNNKVDFDDYTENYNQLLKDSTSFFSPNEAYFAKYKIDIVKKQFLKPASKILEYGCGIGRNIPFLKKAFPNAEVSGSDISIASIDIARQENIGVDFFIEYEDINMNEVFDIIFVAGVFHHIPINQRLDVAKILLNRLAPKGRLFVFEHNPYNPVTQRIVNNCPYDEDAVLLKPKELTMILCEAGFEVERKSYCLFFPPLLSKISQLENKIGWLPLGGQYWIEARRS